MCPRPSKRIQPLQRITVSTILARRGVLIAVAIGGLLVAIGAGLLLATSDHLVDPIAFGLGDRRDGRGMVQRGALLAGSTPWQSTRSLPSRGRGLHGRNVASGSDPAAAPQHRCVGRLAACSSLVLRRLRVPGGSYRRVASDGRCSARLALERLESYVPSLLFSPVVNGNFPQAGCNAACPANGFMIADRPTIADGLFSRDVTTHYLFAVCVRDLRLPDLPASDGDAAAEAGTPACLRPGSDDHRSARGLLRSPCRARAPGCGRALEAELAGHHRYTAQRHTDFCCRSW